MVTDNVDKNIRPSYQCENRQTQALHYCHSCAVKNRVSVTWLCDNRASGKLTIETFLPTENNGDQLTVARARSASQLRDNQINARDTLQGFVPVIADWHTQMCLLEASAFTCSYSVINCTYMSCRSFGRNSIAKSQ